MLSKVAVLPTFGAADTGFERWRSLAVAAMALMSQPAAASGPVCNTDLGLPVSYVVEPSDAGTTIVNNAVVTLRTTGVDAQAFQAADSAQVEIAAPGQQVEPTTTTPTTTPLAATGASSVSLRIVLAAGMVASGCLALFATRRRRSSH